VDDGDKNPAAVSMEDIFDRDFSQDSIPDNHDGVAQSTTGTTIDVAQSTTATTANVAQ
jgi:hypothetical protein